MNLDQLRRALTPLANRIRNVVGRGTLTADANAGAKFQELQIEMTEGDVRAEVEHAEAYGFTSRPKSGAEAVVVFVGGRRDHGVAVAVGDRRFRLLNLEAGGVAVYNDTGAKIVLRANGDIEVTPKSGQKLKVSGSVEVTGDLTATGTVKGTTDVVGGPSNRSLASHAHAAGSLVVTTAPGAVTGATGT